MPESTFERVATVMADELDIDRATVTADSTLDDLGGDSLDALEIMLLLEDEFGIEVEDADFQNTKTVQDVVALVARLVAEKEKQS